MQRLKYAGYTIAFQEVPNEVSLLINVSGCPHLCEGCHSEYLREYRGRYVDEDIIDLLSKYDGLITCVCFMGGEQNKTELIKFLRQTKNFYQIKTCLYSGSDEVNDFYDLLPFLDYLKIGSYKKGFGGLGNPNTNQVFYSVENGSLKDITYEFVKNGIK